MNSNEKTLSSNYNIQDTASDKLNDSNTVQVPDEF